MEKHLAEIDEALSNFDTKKAEVMLAKLLREVQSNDDRAELLFRRAQARLQGAKPDDALEDLQTGLAIKPEKVDDVEVHILQGDIHFARFELAPVGFADRSDTEIALEHYQTAVDYSPQHPLIAWVFYQLGRIKLSEDDVEAALKHFQDSLEAPCNPANIHALSYERMGFIALFEQREAQQALTYFQQSIKTHPLGDDTGWLAQLHLRISRAHLELGHHQEALEEARKGLREIQNSSSAATRAMLPEAHMAIGDVLANMPGEEAEAIKHFLRFLQSSRHPQGIDVTWSQLHETLAQLYFRLERYPEAISAYESTLQYNPYHPWEVNLRYQIARSFYRMRAYERTIEAIQKVRQSAEKDQEAITDWRVYNLMGNAYFALEKYAEAAEAYRHALDLAPPGASGLDKAHIYLRFSEELQQSTS